MKGKERFLLWFLAALIASQIAFLGWGLLWCGQHGGLEACPGIAKRYENTFNVAIATVLALLTGSAVAGVNQHSSLDDRDALASRRTPRTDRLPPEQEISVQALGKQAQAWDTQAQPQKQNQASHKE
jgi:hypothetical protein